MDISHFDLFNDGELRAIAKGGHCAVEAWVHIRSGNTEVTTWHQSLARAELTRRKQERELLGELDQIELEALGAFDSGESLSFRKAYEIVGYIGEACHICPSCTTEKEKKTLRPLFLSEALDYRDSDFNHGCTDQKNAPSCDRCIELLDID